MSYNSLLVIPTSNMASPIVTPVNQVGSPVMVQLQFDAAPSSSLCLFQSFSHEPLHCPSSSQSFLPQPSSALYLPQFSSALSPPHPSPSMCLPQPPSISIPAIMHASPLSEAYIPAVPSQEVVSAYVVPYSIGLRCTSCSSNSNNNRSKGGFKRRLQRLLGGQYKRTL